MKLIYQGWLVVLALTTASAALAAVEQTRGETPPSHEANIERGYARFKGDRRPGILGPPEYASKPPATAASSEESAREPAAASLPTQPAAAEQELPSSDAI